MEAASDDVGSNVAVFPLSVTVPGILVVPALRVNVDVLTVEACTASLNVPVIEEVTPTPVAPPVGTVLVTVGGVLSTGEELLAIYSNGSALLSPSPVKYPRPLPSQIVDGVDPEFLRASLIWEGDAPR